MHAYGGYPTKAACKAEAMKMVAAARLDGLRVRWECTN